MRRDISLAAEAVSLTLRAISAVAAPCCSTAAAIDPAMALISSMVFSMRPTAATDASVAVRTSPMCRVISSVDRAVCVASAFTSLATTAKPLPASPARAASIVAFSASRLVLAAMSLIIFATSPMRLTCVFSASIVARASPPAATARPTTAVDWLICPPISRIEAESCSAALATVWALDSACPAAALAPCADSPVRMADALISPAVAAIPAVRVPTDSSALPVSASIFSAMLDNAALFSASACASRYGCSVSSRARVTAFCLKTSTALAIAPISSPRPVP